MTTKFVVSPLAGALALALSLPVLAAPAPEPQAKDLDGVAVHGHRVQKASSGKYTANLRDTPQTISVIDRTTIDGQNLLSLSDILSTLPGITFGAGEGGGGFGDKINLRGFDASSDITVDGVRDSGLYSRTDPFNLEAVEVVNGANSVYSGAGSVGGTVNLVSKSAGLNEFHKASIAAGTDSYARVTTDSNFVLGEGTALRLNAMAHQNDVPGRDVEQNERWGVAASLAFGLGSDTSWTLNYLHQEDDNTPQYGLPFFNGDVLPGIDRGNYYGYSNIDRQDIQLDSVTSIVDHAFNDNFKIRNLTRWQQADQFSLVDAVQGTWCLANNLTPTGTSCGSTRPGNYSPSGPRGYGRDTRNTTLYNQTDLTVNFTTGAIEHNLVAGFSVLHEEFDLDVTSDFRNPNGTNPFLAGLPQMNIARPDHTYRGPLNRTLTGRTEGELDNRAIYVFDTLKFNEQWQLSLGARYERNEGETINAVVVQAPTAANQPLPPQPIGTITGYGVPFKSNDDLFSYRAGLVYKPVENGSIYIAYGNSKTPSKASVNGSCTAQTCSVDPETAVNYEIGTKWDFLDGRLALTGSVFRNERENYKVAELDNPANLSGMQQLDGSARVDGFMIGLSGLITDQWAVYANYARLDSEVLQGVSDFQANQGRDYTKGDRLTQVPEDSFSLWTTYDISPRWQVGYGATFQGKIWLTQHSATNLNGPLTTYGSYWTHRAMVNYKINRQASLQLNINNLTDEEYFTRIRNNGWATPGDGRQVVLSANFAF
ncbi:TonB-dependent receptor [Lysobacter antibioticus]|uniref:TonB-dependent siderophore receptor family protein n=1 Tax=Lysobacter antibioticus TaxID=84531 RepID=A0A0S2F8C6_LYSAN|nr:TonB-dependent siderophore receptor [Lysobacter antibioticus]ALN79771.1 tonB-dependent siderophore receptor family protein [Lysobacter antibioticus]